MTDESRYRQSLGSRSGEVSLVGRGLLAEFRFPLPRTVSSGSSGPTSTHGSGPAARLESSCEVSSCSALLEGVFGATGDRGEELRRESILEYESIGFAWTPSNSHILNVVESCAP